MYDLSRGGIVGDAVSDHAFDVIDIIIMMRRIDVMICMGGVRIVSNNFCVLLVVSGISLNECCVVSEWVLCVYHGVEGFFEFVGRISEGVLFVAEGFASFSLGHGLCTILKVVVVGVFVVSEGGGGQSDLGTVESRYGFVDVARLDPRDDTIQCTLVEASAIAHAGPQISQSATRHRPCVRR